MTQAPIIEHLTERFKKFPNSKTHFVSAERWQALVNYIKSVGYVQGAINEIRVSGNVIKPVDNVWPG
jgi:hypothetical protein